MDAAGGETFPTEDPRTGDVLLDVAEAQEKDVDRAVQAARKVHFLFQSDPTAELDACLSRDGFLLAVIATLVTAGIRPWPLAKDVRT